MQALGTYILRLCCCSIIAGIVVTIGGSGPGSRIRKMICGLFIIFAAISPLREMEPDEFWDLPDALYQDGMDISTAAQKDVNEAVSEVIIEKTRTYILDEANSLNAGILVTQISLDPDTLVPVAVTLSGNVSPYQRALLSDYIDQTLGIGKEGVAWKD